MLYFCVTFTKISAGVIHTCGHQLMKDCQVLQESTHLFQFITDPVGGGTVQLNVAVGPGKSNISCTRVLSHSFLLASVSMSPLQQQRRPPSAVYTTVTTHKQQCAVPTTQSRCNASVLKVSTLLMSSICSHCTHLDST